MKYFPTNGNWKPDGCFGSIIAKINAVTRRTRSGSGRGMRCFPDLWLRSELNSAAVLKKNFESVIVWFYSKKILKSTFKSLFLRILTYFVNITYFTLLQLINQHLFVMFILFAFESLKPNSWNRWSLDSQAFPPKVFGSRIFRNQSVLGHWNPH